jgi:hypothetical protein
MPSLPVGKGGKASSAMLPPASSSRVKTRSQVTPTIGSLQTFNTALSDSALAAFADVLTRTCVENEGHINEHGLRNGLEALYRSCLDDGNVGSRRAFRLVIQVSGEIDLKSYAIYDEAGALIDYMTLPFPSQVRTWLHNHSQPVSAFDQYARSLYRTIYGPYLRAKL